MMWAFDEGVTLARTINEETRHVGWYANIGGGVLHKGFSNHDLDLVFIPHHNARVEDLHGCLKSLGWTMVRDAEKMRTGWKLPDKKHVEEWRLPDSKRVDVILLRTENS